MSMRSSTRRLFRFVRRAVLWGDQRLPPGVRSAVGVVLVILGPFGFLPVLGFWMVPVGLGLIALDIRPLRRRMLDWLERRQ